MFFASCVATDFRPSPPRFEHRKQAARKLLHLRPHQWPPLNNSLAMAIYTLLPPLCRTAAAARNTRISEQIIQALKRDAAVLP